MPEHPSRRWLFVRLPVDPDAPARDASRPLSFTTSSALVAIGGVLGSLARAGFGVLLPHRAGTWPWATLSVNVIGSGLLAFLLVTLLERHPHARLPRPLIGTGMIGGFTTFSTFAVDVAELGRAGRGVFAVIYVAVTLLGTGAAAVCGLGTGRAVDRLLDKERWHRRVHAAGFFSRDGETR